MDLSFGEILVLLIVIGFFINQGIKNWKGRKSYTTQIIDSLKDLMKYFLSEKRGNIVQLLNAALGFLIVILFLVSLSLVVYDYHVTSKIQTTFLTIVIISLLSFFVVLPVCEKYTRHQYKTLL